MKLLVCGSRSIFDPVFVSESIEDCPWNPTTIMHGGADGVDKCVEKSGKLQMKYSTEVHPIPEWVWDHMGRKAGPVRNSYMVEQADAVLAIWDGESRGTKDTFTKAQRAGLPLRIITVDVDETSGSGVDSVVRIEDSDNEQARFSDFVE